MEKSDQVSFPSFSVRQPSTFYEVENPIIITYYYVTFIDIFISFNSVDRENI